VYQEENMRKKTNTPIAQIHMDDFGSYSRFAMEPVCEKTWSSITTNSWVIHHVGAKEIECMWHIDVANGLYTGTWRAEAFPELCPCVENTNRF
jgi:hypothetical protein